MKLVTDNVQYSKGKDGRFDLARHMVAADRACAGDAETLRSAGLNGGVRVGIGAVIPRGARRLPGPPCAVIRSPCAGRREPGILPTMEMLKHFDLGMAHWLIGVLGGPAGTEAPARVPSSARRLRTRSRQRAASGARRPQGKPKG